jgi:hypothetical protein
MAYGARRTKELLPAPDNSILSRPHRFRPRCGNEWAVAADEGVPEVGHRRVRRTGLEPLMTGSVFAAKGAGHCVFDMAPPEILRNLEPGGR